MRLTVTSMEKSSIEILTHFTCKEGTYIGIFHFKIPFKKYRLSLRFSEFVDGTVLRTF